MKSHLSKMSWYLVSIKFNNPSNYCFLTSLIKSVNSYILETCINSIEYSERQKQIKQVEEEKIDFKKL